MVLALIFRGVAFEFRWRDPRHRRYWDAAFIVGSIVATLAQGITLGGLLQGIAVNGRAYGGGWWDWLTPFSVAVGVALVCGYALLGATWLIMKSERALLDIAYALALRFGLATIVAIGVVSAWTPFLAYEYYHRWFAWPQVLFTAQVPLLVAIASVAFFFALRRRSTYWPFLIALVLFALGLAGLGISLYPYVVPRSITIWDAAAPPQSLGFMLVGAAIMIPIILIYTGYAYWVFHGKTSREGYH
jgi:cytochrome d ubiquinol oxidase subunit II